MRSVQLTTLHFETLLNDGLNIAWVRTMIPNMPSIGHIHEGCIAQQNAKFVPSEWWIVCTSSAAIGSAIVLTIWVIMRGVQTMLWNAEPLNDLTFLGHTGTSWRDVSGHCRPWSKNRAGDTNGLPLSRKTLRRLQTNQFRKFSKFEILQKLVWRSEDASLWSRFFALDNCLPMIYTGTTGQAYKPTPLAGTRLASQN